LNPQIEMIEKNIILIRKVCSWSGNGRMEGWKI